MLKNFLKSFLLSLLLLAGGAFTAADLPLKAVHFEPPFLCSRAEAAISMTFDEMYAGVSSLGITFSDKLKNSEGQMVQMTGFMAPPLTPTINFFVLTREPMSICPFCSTEFARFAARMPTGLRILLLYSSASLLWRCRLTAR